MHGDATPVIVPAVVEALPHPAAINGRRIAKTAIGAFHKIVLTFDAIPTFILRSRQQRRLPANSLQPFMSQL
jgi:hypothetical protein